MNVAAMPAHPHGASETEWAIRGDLADLYRLVAHHRWTDFIHTHLSARLPGPERAYAALVAALSQRREVVLAPPEVSRHTCDQFHR